jgi:penicillin-binding protein 2
MATWLRRFGFGERTGLDPDFESAGLIGTPEWSQRVRKTPWYPGEAVSVSIGQGPLLVTLVQLARAFAVLANGGHLIQPHLVSSDPEATAVIDLDHEDLNVVNAALSEVVHGPRGTARRLARLPIAGKTGTAQVVRLQEGVDSDDLASHLRHHAWFVGWAPLNNPEIVVTVIVEHGGDGGAAAAPVAGRVVEAYLGLDGENPAPPSPVTASPEDDAPPGVGGG